MIIFNSDQDDDDDDADSADGNNDAGWVGLSHANVPPSQRSPWTDLQGCTHFTRPQPDN